MCDNKLLIITEDMAKMKEEMAKMKAKLKSLEGESQILENSDGSKGYGLVKSGKRRISVSDFRGKLLVNIREYYEKDGKMLPGKLYYYHNL